MSLGSHLRDETRAWLGHPAGGGARAGKGFAKFRAASGCRYRRLLNGGDKVPDIRRGGSWHPVPQGSPLRISQGSRSIRSLELGLKGTDGTKSLVEP